MVLTNQRTIIDNLMNQQPASSVMPVISTADKDDNPLAELHHSKDPSADPHQPSSELTIAELEGLKNSKKKGTKDSHFAVILLKKYTTLQECLNCTVYREGRKSKGLGAHILAKIKKKLMKLSIQSNHGVKLLRQSTVTLENIVLSKT